MAGLDGLLRGLDPDEYRRGKQFEQIVAWFLTHAPEYQTQLRHVWLWDDWPERPSPDLGIDLVAETCNGGLWAIQAKAYASTYSVTKRDLDSFLAASAPPWLVECRIVLGAEEVPIGNRAGGLSAETIGACGD